jgi:peptide/nickel transport system substrate-binding protein
LVYEFKLRPRLRFHNGEPCTAEDVKFSFERYKGGSAAELRANVQRVEAVDPLTVRFHLNEPWPDFLTFYGTSATAAALVVPKKYLEEVGEEGFKKHPIGLGPYRFVSFKPGVELVLEAFEGYWRKVPHVKRLIMKGVPEGATRLAMLKKGEADYAVALQGPLAEEVKRDSRLTLVDTRHPSMFWIEFADQWDPKSPWHDQRVRLAVNYALDRQAINEAACLGYCPPAGVIVPRLLDYALPVEPFPYDPQKALRLLAEAGYPNGFDAGDYFCDAAIVFVGEPVVNYLNAAGIRVKLRPIERAAFFRGWAEKKYKGLIQGASAAYGNAATRIEAFVAGGGTYVYGSYPDIDGLFQEQASDLDPKRREATLHRIQQLMHDKAMFAPVWLNAGLNGVGARVEESGIGLVAGYAFSAPYEDVKLKGK